MTLDIFYSGREALIQVGSSFAAAADARAETQLVYIYEQHLKIPEPPSGATAAIVKEFDEQREPLHSEKCGVVVEDRSAIASAQADGALSAAITDLESLFQESQRRRAWKDEWLHENQVLPTQLDPITSLHPLLGKGSYIVRSPYESLRLEFRDTEDVTWLGHVEVRPVTPMPSYQAQSEFFFVKPLIDIANNALELMFPSKRRYLVSMQLMQLIERMMPLMSQLAWYAGTVNGAFIEKARDYPTPLPKDAAWFSIPPACPPRNWMPLVTRSVHDFYGVAAWAVKLFVQQIDEAQDFTKMNEAFYQPTPLPAALAKDTSVREMDTPLVAEKNSQKKSRTLADKCQNRVPRSRTVVDAIQFINRYRTAMNKGESPWKDQSSLLREFLELQGPVIRTKLESMERSVRRYVHLLVPDEVIAPSRKADR